MFNIFRKKKGKQQAYILIIKKINSQKTMAFPTKKIILLVKKKPAVLLLPSVDQNENINIATSI